MSQAFAATLHKPAEAAADWVFVQLPKGVSDTLPRRGRTTVQGRLNGQAFQATLEPDGQLSHWLRVGASLQAAAGVRAGDVVQLELEALAQEPEPEVPADLQQALQADAAALEVWKATTTLARLDWVHWVESAKQAKTRAKRIGDACQMLASGKKRVCCFDPSGFYSKALSLPRVAPEAAAEAVPAAGRSGAR